jgi:hypothetical protein
MRYRNLTYSSCTRTAYSRDHLSSAKECQTHGAGWHVVLLLLLLLLLMVMMMTITTSSQCRLLPAYPPFLLPRLLDDLVEVEKATKVLETSQLSGLNGGSGAQEGQDQGSLEDGHGGKRAALACDHTSA